jgi:hypothetical protein
LRSESVEGAAILVTSDDRSTTTWRIELYDEARRERPGVVALARCETVAPPL